jgi:hypothetical protein
VKILLEDIARLKTGASVPKADRGQKSESQRWQECHGDQLKFDVLVGAHAIQIGDEIFDISDFEDFEPRKKTQFKNKHGHRVEGE